MNAYSLDHLADDDLLDGLATLVCTSRATEAAMLAHLAEVDARKLYLAAACASMHVYCVRVLRMSEDAAFKRITAARTARRFPTLFGAVADGRLHLTAVGMLAPHLTDDNVNALVASACHRSKREIELVLAAYAPRPDLPDRLAALSGPSGILSIEQLAPERVGDADVPPVTRTTPLAPQRFALQVTIDQATHEKLERAQALLRHRLPSGDLAHVLDRALDALLATLAKEKFAATDRPRRSGRRSEARRSRRVPHEVRRAVHERDGEQCAFVSADGARCGERGFLELDHLEPVSVGGRSTEANVRILCAAHNQYEAERRFGRGFMARRRRDPQPPAVTRADTGKAPCSAAAPDFDADVMSALRGLGVKPVDAGDALARSAHVPATTLEDRLLAAVKALRTTYAGRCSDGRPSWPASSNRPVRRPAASPAAVAGDCSTSFVGHGGRGTIGHGVDESRRVLGGGRARGVPRR